MFLNLSPDSRMSVSISFLYPFLSHNLTLSIFLNPLSSTPWLSLTCPCLYFSIPLSLQNLSYLFESFSLSHSITHLTPSIIFYLLINPDFSLSLSRLYLSLYLSCLLLFFLYFLLTVLV